jgi:hypothetical protein
MRRAWLAKIYIYIYIYIYKYKENSKVGGERGEKKNKKGFGVLSWRRSEMGPSGV